MSAASVKEKVIGWFDRHAWHWTTLHHLRENPAVKYSWVWLSLVPFVMRFIVEWQPHVAFALDLPVNFVLCYLAAIFFLLAAWPYGQCCPVLVKEAPSYGVFLKHQHSEVELRNWFREVVPVKDAPAEADPGLVLHYLSIIRIRQSHDRGSGGAPDGARGPCDHGSVLGDTGRGEAS